MLVHNIKPRLVDIHSKDTSLHLQPGVNDVPPALWAKVQDHPVLKALIACGDVALPTVEVSAEATNVGIPAGVQGPQANATEGANVVGLQQLSNKEAVRLVGETVDQELLGKWLEQAGDRKAVREAIERQLEKLKS